MKVTPPWGPDWKPTNKRIEWEVRQAGTGSHTHSLKSAACPKHGLGFSYSRHRYKESFPHHIRALPPRVKCIVMICYWRYWRGMRPCEFFGTTFDHVCYTLFPLWQLFNATKASNAWWWESDLNPLMRTLLHNLHCGIKRWCNRRRRDSWVWSCLGPSFVQLSSPLMN